MRARISVLIPIGLVLCLSCPAAAAVDYARDIQPLFEKNCYECHGPKKQRNGFRLDRKSRAFAGSVRHNINPGSSASSRVYMRVRDSQFGTQMPPEHTLSPEEIELIRQWIDEGAPWPDELANEDDPPPPDPAALALIESIRGMSASAERRQAVTDAILRSPEVLNARGPDGATPLMYLAQYGDAETLRAALAAGGNPNQVSDAGTTALIWAIEDGEKVRVLLEAGADANAETPFRRTPLQLAAYARNEAAAEALLVHGATPSPGALGAAAFGSEPILRRLLAAGAKDKGDSAAIALRVGCVSCLDAYPPEIRDKVSRGLFMLAPVSAPGDPALLRVALEHGADVHVLSPKGHTMLMTLAISEQVPPDILQTLIDRGIDVNARGPEGLTALDHAYRLGRPPTIEVLERNGGKSTITPSPAPARFVADNTARAAITRALPLLQTSSKLFYERGGCVACHHNLQTAFAVKEARRRSFAVDEALDRHERETLAHDVDVWREHAVQGVTAPGGAATTTGYLLMAIATQGYAPDHGSDLQARLLRIQQRADGRWQSPVRPPIEYSEFTATAVSLRGLQLYGGDNRPASDAAVARGARWLEASKPLSHEDRVFRLAGLTWADNPKKIRDEAMRELLSTQRADGGWAQTEWRSSDAYATGSALFALNTAGLSTRSRAYKRGVKYLLGTQLEDGTWYVRSRTLATQAYFESGFPHGADQYISAAATNWAVLALLYSLPDARAPLVAARAEE